MKIIKKIIKLMIANRHKMISKNNLRRIIILMLMLIMMNPNNLKSTLYLKMNYLHLPQIILMKKSHKLNPFKSSFKKK